MRAYLYPGQGSQKVGMGKDLVEEFPIAQQIYQKSDEILGFSISNISFEGPESLNNTRYAQLAILVYSHVAGEILKLNGVSEPDFVAGHSLGEFSAILKSGMLSFEDALKVVRKRGELMSEADPEGKGGMAAVLGLDDALVIEICKEVSREKYVEPVNFNSPGQVVISGYKEAIDLAEVRLKAAGAKRVLKLAVSGAFHSKLMEKVSDEFAKFLSNIDFRNPKCRLIANVTAEEMNEKNVRDLLVKQLKSPVLWTQSIRKLKSLGLKECVEVGFGNVVSGLVKKIDDTLQVQSWNQLIGK